MKTDMETPIRQGLIKFKSIPYEKSGSRQLLTLIKNGLSFLTHTQSVGNGRALHHDFTKPREAHHDADLYRLHQKKTVKIEGHGGRKLRIVLNYKLKKHLYGDLAKVGKRHNSAYGKHSITGSQDRSRKDSRARCSKSNTKIAMENGLAWTLNLLPLAIAIEISLKNSVLVLALRLMRMICQNLGASWISMN